MSSVIIRASDLVGFFGEHVLVRGHHIEPPREVGEPGTQVHLIFELLVNLIVMEVSVGEKPVEAPHDIMQVLLGVLRDRHPVKVV